MVYRPKWKIALEQYQRAIAKGLRFSRLTFNEGYDSKGPMVWQAKRLVVYRADEDGPTTC